jgi:succinate dehydrogenase/fumarate reductase cytochrome b subunit
MFRGCGVLMFVGLAGLGGVSLMSDKKFPAYVYQLQQMPALNFLVKFFVAFPLSYHLLGGLRHIAWDHIIFHNLESARTSGLAAIGVSAAIAAVASVSQSEPLE